MKRSEINNSIKRADSFLKSVNFVLPRFAHWTKEDWAGPGKDVLKKSGLGWDVTDFGINDFERIGAVLFTLRNGAEDLSFGTPYSEKIIYLRDGQRLPRHRHMRKVTDIINRDGATLWVKLWNANKDGSVDETGDVAYYSDGVPLTAKAGEAFEITRGNSITLTPEQYHIFGAKGGDLLLSEVSLVNDDTADNGFTENAGGLISVPESGSRYIDVEEDEPAVYPLCNEH